MVIGFGPEMNADWRAYGYSHTPAPKFVAAWRHIVSLFRALGADNVTWLWTTAADGTGTAPITSWWPGSNYVTWVGIDGFYAKPSDTFNNVFVSTIDQVRTLTAKPILLSDTGVARNGSQFANILNLFDGIARYRLLGLVWSDNGKWRIEDSPPAKRAFQAGAAGLRPALNAGDQTGLVAHVLGRRTRGSDVAQGHDSSCREGWPKPLRHRLPGPAAWLTGASNAAPGSGS